LFERRPQILLQYCVSAAGKKRTRRDQLKNKSATHVLLRRPSLIIYIRAGSRRIQWRKRACVSGYCCFLIIYICSCVRVLFIDVYFILRYKNDNTIDSWVSRPRFLLVVAMSTVSRGSFGRYHTPCWYLNCGIWLEAAYY